MQFISLLSIAPCYWIMFSGHMYVNRFLVAFLPTLPAIALVAAAATGFLFPPQGQ
jgi:hypothetical protein